MMFKTSLLVSTMLAGALAAGAAHAADGADAAQPPPGARSAGQPGVSPPGVTPGVGAGASTNQTGAAQQQLNQGRSGGQADTSAISEIVVTAEKREQSLQQVPVAVSAFTAEKRDIIGIQSIVDQTNYTPGLTYQPSLDRLSLRGIGRLTNAHTADSGTAIYVDGVFTTSTTEAGRDPLFVERTEILRGPQGTLYGRNSIGGAYNIISRQPTKDFSGEARVEIGNYDEQTYEARISGPITDWLRFSLGYQKVYQGEGYAKNLTGLSSEDGVRDRDYYEAQLAGELGKFDFWFYYGKQTWNDRSVPGSYNHNFGSFVPSESSISGNGTNIFPTYSFAFNGGRNVMFTGPVAGNPNLVTGNLRNFETDTAYNDKLTHNDVYRTHLTYHFDDFDVKYVGGFVRYDYNFNGDTDNTSVTSFQVPLSANAGPVTVLGGRPVTCAQLAALGACGPATVSGQITNRYDENEEFYSHELTIASTWDKPLQYIAGLYFYHEYGTLPNDVYDPGQPQLRTPISAIAGLAVPTNPQGSYLHSNYFANISSKAAYGQLDWKIIPTLKLTGGIRYTQDDKKVSEEERIICYGTTLCATPLNVFGTLAPAVDVTLASAGTLSAAQVAQGLKQQGVISSSYDPVTGYAKRRLQDGSNDVTGTAGVEWTPDRRTLVYGKYSRGYKAFGFNSPVGSGFSTFPYTKPEQIDAFEAGLKKDWTSRFQTNITGFYDRYYDAQVPVTIPQNGAPSLSVFYNIPLSIIQGVELESIWAPIDKLNVLLTYAYLDAHIDQANGLADPNDPTATFAGATPSGGNALGSVDTLTGLPSRGQNLKGAQLPLSPKNKVAFNINYDLELGRYGDLIPSFSYTWRDSQYSSIFNRAYNFSPDRDQIDLRVTWKAPGNKFEVIGYAQNVLNSTNFEYKTGVRYSTGAVYSQYFLTDPRTYGVQLQARF